MEAEVVLAALALTTVVLSALCADAVILTVILKAVRRGRSSSSVGS